MSNNKQSSVEYLMDKLFDQSSMVKEQLEWFEQAKEMHKEDIKEAFNEGFRQAQPILIPNTDISEYNNAEQYYNETFNTKKK